MHVITSNVRRKDWNKFVSMYPLKSYVNCNSRWTDKANDMIEVFTEDALTPLEHYLINKLLGASLHPDTWGDAV